MKLRQKKGRAAPGPGPTPRPEVYRVDPAAWYEVWSLHRHVPATREAVSAAVAAGELATVVGASRQRLAEGREVIRWLKAVLR